MDDREYEEIAFEAERGDLIVLYSDGITDQPNAKEDDFDRKRLSKSLRSRCGKSPEEVADGILADVDSFADGTPVHDDQTLIVLKVQ